MPCHAGKVCLGKDEQHKKMLKKYKKIGLVAAACALLGVSASQAQVLLTFAQDGANVTATWSGNYNFVAARGNNFALSQGVGGATLNSTAAFGLDAGEFLISSGEGTATATSLVASTGGYSTSTDFGFNGSSLLFGSDYLSEPENVRSVIGQMTFANTTLSALGASDFNNTLAFNGGGFAGGREIRFTTAAIPEPSTWVLVGFGLMALFYRYQRRNQGA